MILEVMEDKSFLGKGWSFTPEFDQERGKVRMVAEEEDIKQSLAILLSTAPSERVHRFDFGCGIRQFAYELMTRIEVSPRSHCQIFGS